MFTVRVEREAKIEVNCFGPGHYAIQLVDAEDETPLENGILFHVIHNEFTGFYQIFSAQIDNDTPIHQDHMGFPFVKKYPSDENAMWIFLEQSARWFDTSPRMQWRSAKEVAND